MVVKKLLLVTVAIIMVAVILIPVCETSEKEPLAVVVLAGQSNAQYRSANVDIDEMNAQGFPENDVYYYGDMQPVWYATPQAIVYDTTFGSYAVHSMLNQSKTSWLIGSEDAQIALKLSEKLDCDVLVINVAIGNANIEYLQPGNTGGIYVQNVINKALIDVQNQYRIVKAGWIWIQGESDKLTSVNTYVDRFNSIDSWYGSKGFDTCYMVITKPSDSGNANTAQLQICETHADVIKASTAPASFTTENGLLASDNLHYTQAGRIIVADDIVEVMDVDLSPGMTVLMIIPVLIIAAIIISLVAVFRDRSV